MISYFDSFIINCYVRIKIKIEECYNDRIKHNGLNRTQLEIITSCITNELEYLISNKKYIDNMILTIVDALTCNIDTLLKINKLILLSKQEIIDLIYQIIKWHYDTFILDDLDNKKIINHKFDIETMRSTNIDKPLFNKNVNCRNNKFILTSTNTPTNNCCDEKTTFKKESKSLPRIFSIDSINTDERKVQINDDPTNFRSWLY